MTTSQERQSKTEANRLAHQARVAMVETMHDKGYSNAAIAQKLGISESSVRVILKGG